MYYINTRKSQNSAINDEKVYSKMEMYFGTVQTPSHINNQYTNYDLNYFKQGVKSVNHSLNFDTRKYTTPISNAFICLPPSYLSNIQF